MAKSSDLANRFLCSVCNRWMADTESARQIHNASSSHRSAYQASLKSKLAESKDQTKIKPVSNDNNLLKDIPESYFPENQSSESNRNFLLMSRLNQAVLPPSLSNSQVSTVLEANLPDAGLASSGRYKIRNEVYYDGSKVEELLHGGMECEIWSDEQSAWCVGNITGRTKIMQPNSSIIIYSFTVYVQGDDADRSVGSDSIRIHIKSGQDETQFKQFDEDRLLRSMYPGRMKNVVSDDIGGWETVEIEPERQLEEEDDEVVENETDVEPVATLSVKHIVESVVDVPEVIFRKRKRQNE